MAQSKHGPIDIKKGKELLTQLGFDVSSWDTEPKKKKERSSGDIIDHQWGSETLLVVSDDYNAKILKMIPGRKFSLHFHAKKHETIYVMSGEYAVISIDSQNGITSEDIIRKGDLVINPPNSPHQIRCIREGELMEISNKEIEGDHYRIGPGDNQQKRKR